MSTPDPSRRAASLAAALLLASACATVTMHEQLPRIGKDSRYDALFPYYVELCALSQIRANFAPHGGSPGHAAMYIKGACRDDSTEFPTLKVCDPEVDLADPEAGTGVSVNRFLRNVNWMAVPGKALFYYGNLEPEEMLNVEAGLAAIDAADRAGVFRGLEIHDPPAPDDEEAMLYLAASETLGTDFALTFGRTMYCARLPLGRRQLVDIIDYLNDLNRDYALGGRDYRWSGYSDNCAHTLRNSLAAAGIWAPKSVATYRLGQLANLSVPANEVADLALLITEFPIDDIGKIVGDDIQRRTLARRNWLPRRHGAMVKLIPVHQRNELYETDVAIFMLRNPLRRGKSRKVGALYSLPRNTDLEANLLYYKQLYADILADRPEDWQALPGDTAKHRARSHYYQYIEAQLADVNEKIAKLRTLPAR